MYYSRSGHSEATALEIARTFNAPIAQIDAASRAPSQASGRPSRTQGSGASDPPFYKESNPMLFGDVKKMLRLVLTALKSG